MQRIFFILGALLLVLVGALYFLGRGRIESSAAKPRPRVLERTTQIETLTLYFGDSKRIGFVSEARSSATGSNLEARARAVIRELAQGPLESGLPVLPAEARLEHAFLDRWGIAYLDFDRGILSERKLDGQEWLMVGSIVRSICVNFPEVRAVRFMVAGEMVTSLSGYVDLEEPLTAADFALAP
ncbi:MAG: GerMN domain-containing protein [Candidatus Eisenbacteria bacterium]|nr:GerMN domain-containing protein [Candidatus Eisenbacteria bacterium]